MTLEELEEQLRAWGRIYGERPVYDDEPMLGGSMHPIAAAMTFAPGKRSAVIRQRTHLDRGGQSRRRLMARGHGVEGFGMVPASFVDPVPCRETRPAVYGLGETSRPVPPEVQRVQRAALDLHAIDTLRGVCLRVHYCTLGDLDEKACKATLRVGSTVKVRAYRDAVREARFWMLGRLAA